MTRPKLMSFAPRTSLPLVVKNPFESIAGRNRCVSRPSPLFGVTCARALTPPSATATPHSAPHARIVLMDYRGPFYDREASISPHDLVMTKKTDVRCRRSMSARAASVLVSFVAFVLVLATE